MKFDFDNENRKRNSKTKIILKKTAFSLLIFIFETFAPLLTGFEMIVSLFLNYFIITCLWLFGFKGAAEAASNSLVIAAVAGAVFIIIIHLLYHIIIDGIFNAGLLIEMDIELFAVFIFFSVRDYKDKDINEFMPVAKYVFLAAACLYAVMLAVYFTAKFFKKKKH